MVSVNFKLDMTLIVQTRTAYDAIELFGDTGGLLECFYFVLTPLIAFLIGHRYNLSLFSNLYWVNESGNDGESNQSAAEKIKDWTQ